MEEFIVAWRRGRVEFYQDWVSQGHLSLVDGRTRLFGNGSTGLNDSVSSSLSLRAARRCPSSMRPT